MIVVSGGTKGIGRAIIERFAAQGYNIATCARNRDDLSQLKTAISDQYGVSVYVQSANLAIKEDLGTFIDFVLRIGEPIEALVNNTGVFLPGAIHSEDDGNLEQMIETNLYSAYRLSRGLLPAMMAQKDGHIFNIASIASFMAYGAGGSYAISKHAMLGFSKCLREEMKPHNLRVTAVMPGATYTASWEGAGIPEDRFSKAEDVADMVWAAFKVSKRSVVEDIIIRPQLGDI